MASSADIKATLWLSLRFEDGGTETGFIQAHAEKLAFNMACLSMIGVVLACTALGFNCNLYESCPTPAAAQVEKEAMYILIGCAVQYFVVACCFQTRHINGRIGFVEREFLVVALLVEALLVNAFIDPYYLAKVQGYDCYALWPDRHFTDSSSLLFVDGIITAAHMMLPLRWFVLVPVQVVGVLRYASLGLLFSPEDLPFVNLVFLAALVYVASVGKRTLEQHERLLFSSFLAEKSLRFQSEFELSQVARVIGAAQPESASSCGGESVVPSTTDSGHAFNSAVSMEPGDLQHIAQIGAREQWLVAAGELEIEAARVLGAGSFGVVFSGCYQGTPVAVKMRKTRSGLNSPAQLLQLCNELRILRRLRHPNIVFLYGACLDTNHGDLALVLELVDGVQLRHFIWSGSSPDSGRASPMDQRGPSDAARSQVLLDMSCALRYLHTRTPRIVHGDLKDTNVLVEPSRAPCSHRAKLLDFGLARVCTRHARVLGGTLRWVAPELVGNRVRAPNSSADVFSFGRLVFFVLTGRFPIENVSRSKLRQFLKSAELPELQWGHAGRDAAAYRPLVEECTQVDPSVRPRMTQVHARLAVLHGGEGSARLGDGDRAAPAVDLADSAAMLQRMRGIISTPTHKVAAAAASACSVPMPPSAAADFAEESSFQRSRHLSPVPEDGVNNGGTGTTQSPEADSSQPLALPAFQRTPRKTQLLMLIDVIMHCNIEMPPGACCFFHAGARQLKVVCDELEGRACLDMRDRGVSGQCKECGALGREDPAASRSASYLDVVRECFFCGGVVELCNNASTGNSCDSI
ncbi:unnamed protein product [Prorocentrum cordatum]|uniref:Protein kinase domain-containing protein n=1 Tax=Prorocentrum cordatum TaxID=2364126 RepID=A0ABN9T7J7_9DINO|nr:unnamed protein product [Polarella glacialis]